VCHDVLQSSVEYYNSTIRNELANNLFVVTFREALLSITKKCKRDPYKNCLQLSKKKWQFKIWAAMLQGIIIVSSAVNMTHRINHLWSVTKS
jgi:hypothetical protein